MKIAIFSDTFFPSLNGVVTFVYQSAKGLVQAGHQVLIFTVSKDSKKILNEREKDLTIIKLPSLPAWVYSGERLALPIGLAIPRLKKFKPDIIHVHTPMTVGWEAVLAAKILKIPLVGTHHTFYDHYLKHAKLDYNWAKKLSWKYTVGYYNRCDLILSPSQSLARTLVEKGLKKPINVIQNFIDTDLFKPVSNETAKKKLKKRFNIKGKSLIFEGRLSYEKNLGQVLKSFALMLKKMPDLKLMLVGDGPERNNLEKLTDILKIKKSVIFTGLLPYGQAVVESFQANDVFLTASKSENMPISILEALATGLPLVMVKEKGLAELIKENVNGFFVKTDNPEDMAQKTIALLADEKLLRKFSQASRALAFHYSRKKVVSLLEDLYQKVLKKQL